jgi:hypothetical protein
MRYSNRKYVVTPTILQQLKDGECICNQCKKPLPEEHSDWYSIEYYCGIEDEDGNPIKVHSWLCPDCGVSMVTGTSKSFSISSSI